MIFDKKYVLNVYGRYITLYNAFSPMEMNEENLEQLKQLCVVCRFRKKCKDINKVCAFKKMAWKLAEREYKKRIKGALK